MREAMTHVAWKNHANGARNPRAQFRKPIPKEKIAAAPLVAGRFGVLDCSGVSDGGRMRSDRPRRGRSHRWTTTETPMYVQGGLRRWWPGSWRAAASMDPGYDYSTFPEVVASAADAYRQAGITDPAGQISLAEVHDCFTPTELILMEDLGFCGRGEAWKHVLDGAFDLDGTAVGESGRRPEVVRPPGRRERAADAVRVLAAVPRRGRRASVARPAGTLALTGDNLGGRPGACVSFVSVVGSGDSE